MNFETLKNALSHLNPSRLQENLWHQHPRGLGWVENTACVEDTAHVGSDALVYGNAQVYENAWVHGNARVCKNAQVFGNAQVCGNARVHGNAWVFENARVSKYAWVYGNAWVYRDAQVYENAQVHGDARVTGDTKGKSPLHIQGSRNSVTHCAPQEIAIGCEIHSISHWLEHYQEIGSYYVYSQDEIKKYKRYIDLIISEATE